VKSLSGKTSQQRLHVVPSPKVVRDAGVELVARFQQLTTVALLLQTLLDFLQRHVACTDLLCGQLACREEGKNNTVC